MADPLFIVIVPADGVKVPPDGTLNVPATIAVSVPLVEPLTVKFE